MMAGYLTEVSPQAEPAMTPAQAVRVIRQSKSLCDWCDAPAELKSKVAGYWELYCTTHWEQYGPDSRSLSNPGEYIKAPAKPVAEHRHYYTRETPMVRSGADCWNPDYVAFVVFQRWPEVVAVYWDYTYTGLWCDVNVVYADGLVGELRVNA